MEESDFLEKYLKLLKDKSSDFYIEEQEFEKELFNGYLVEFKKCKSMLLPSMVINVDSIKTLELRQDDTFVVGFPKSGTTWTEEIVWLLQNDLDFDKALNTKHFERVMFIDTGLSKGKLKELESSNMPRVFKSHLPIQFLPDQVESKSKASFNFIILFFKKLRA